MLEMDSVIKEFLVESYENLDQLDRDLVALEKDPHNRDRLSSIFRTIHTIKGTCGFFGFSKLEAVTHVGETLLSLLRDGILLLDLKRTTALLALVDAVRSMLGCIEKKGTDGTDQYTNLIAQLTALQEIDAAPVEKLHVTAPPPVHESVPKKEVAEHVSAPIATPVIEDSKFEVSSEQKESSSPAEANRVAVVDTNIRVDVSLLDKLMNLVGELVLARNQILQFSAKQIDSSFLNTTQRLNLITTELQEGVMKTRMQPIGNIWNRLPRVVRDLAMSCGKEINLEMEGKETELDKSIIEAIKDPLTHIVRNSIDHGIEKPSTRRAAGKPETGTLLLRAFHEGGKVNIEIIDDGGGVNTERVKAKALERGLISREQANRMTDRDATNLLFLPGFSTAEKITNVSGRGVGMDVVKTNIEKIGGTVDIQSLPGKGTTIKIKIPLTLAIIPALIVSSGGDRYAIPQVSLLELVRLEGEQIQKSIEHIHGAPVFRLRGQLLPLVYLSQELGQKKNQTDDLPDCVNIIFLRADDRKFGLVVEKINDTEEIVVKPLNKLLKSITVFAGSTIMGDGKVALILDVLGIAQRSGVVTEVRDRSLAEKSQSLTEKQSENQTLLLLGLGKDRRAAIPLSMVARLEEIPSHCLEQADQQEVVQYRGIILPIIRLSNVLGVDSNVSGEELMQVVVYTEKNRSIGLVVDRILDIVETTIDVTRVKKSHGIVASAVIQKRVTDLLDIHTIIRSVDPEFFDTAVAV